MPSLKFGNLYELLDSLMLFGATIESTDAAEGSWRLRIRRNKMNGRKFAWAWAITESQDEGDIFRFLRMTFSLADAQVWDARTQSTRFLQSMRERWYGIGPGVAPGTGPTTRRTPHLDLTDEMLTFWLVGSDSLTWLTSTGMTAAVGKRLAGIINKKYGWPCQFIPAVCGRHAAGLDLAKGDRTEIEAWLEARVPRVVWDRRTV